MERLVLVREVDEVLKELRALARGSKGQLGPKVLLDFEIRTLKEAISKAKRSAGEDDLQRCLTEGRRLLIRLRQSHPSQDPE